MMGNGRKKQGGDVMKKAGKGREFVDKAGTCRNIYRLMQERDITVMQVAEILNISCQAVYGWIKGEKFPRLEHLFTLKYVLGTTVEDMIRLKEGLSERRV